jgi:delta24-sterol reductase
VYDGVAACKRMEQWLIDNHSFQALYAVTELTEKDFWVMFDQTLYRSG